MKKTIAEQEVDIDAEGYMTNMDEWNGDIAREIATELGINELTQQHWDIMDWLREQRKNEESVNIRRVGKSGIVDIKQFYKLFPGGPLKNASKIAGLRKPTSCL